MKMDKEKGRLLLLHVADILEELNIPFFLMQGSALGAYRDKGFVSNEKDIDIGILIENFDAASIAGSLVQRNIEVETWHRHAPFSFCHTIVAYYPGFQRGSDNSAKMDIVGLHLWKDKRFTCTPYDPREVLRPYAIVHDRELLENYQQIEIFGRTFNIPSPIETYLVREYGNWKTPREDSISKTRIYNYLKSEGMTFEYFNTKPKSNS